MQELSKRLRFMTTPQARALYRNRGIPSAAKPKNEDFQNRFCERKQWGQVLSTRTHAATVSKCPYIIRLGRPFRKRETIRKQ